MKVNYIVTQNIDYLSFTLKVPRIMFDDKVYNLIKSPNKNYNMCEQANSGALHLWHTSDERVGHHYVFSAQPLEYLRQRGFDEREIIKWCLEKSQITRIDLAVTSQPENDQIKHGFTPHAVAWACRDQLLKSRLKPAKDIVSEMKTETKYIGNRKTRARLFRAYDKGVDTGMLENFLIRYEMETRKGTKVIARAVVNGDKYGAIIRRYIDFPSHSTWRAIMDAEPAKMQHSKPVLSATEMDAEKSASRWQWLINSIPKTVEKALNEDYAKRGIEPLENEQFHAFIRAIMSKAGD